MPVTKIQILLLTSFLKRNEGKLLSKKELITEFFEIIKLDCPKYARTQVILSFVKCGHVEKYNNCFYYIKKYRGITSSTLRHIVNNGVEEERKKHRMFAK